MKQVTQNFRSGKTSAGDVPCPRPKAGEVLVATRASLISSGTEKMLVEFGRSSLLEKARQQPDKVRMVIDKVKTDGVLATVAAVRSKLDQPFSLGYCSAGLVIDVGIGVQDFSVGDRVASVGKHAEAVAVPRSLCAKIPARVSDAEAAFAPIAAVALQGLRLAAPTLGETFAVAGLGLIGLIAIQLLRASGCRVVGIDRDEKRLALARKFGAETVDLSKEQDPIASVRIYTGGRGVDGVIIAAATSSNEPVHQAAQMCRKRGRIVLVGVTGLELSRADFYEKELSFQVSCSYGPGRYDPNYEEKGQDYPIGFVRWTAQRNFEAVLEMMADRRIEVESLISHRVPIDQAARAYEIVTGAETSLGILLEYPSLEERPTEALRRATVSLSRAERPGKVAVAFIGAGNYATGTLIPAFKRAGARLKSVAASGGVSSVHAGRRSGFEEATTDIDGLFADDGVDAVVIATRHDSHAQLVCRALEAGKHVFVEKPLALTLDELAQIEGAYARAAESASGRIFMVGFNRRFAPQAQKIRALLEDASGPKAFVMTVNAGLVPREHWTQDPVAGGGRIVGEACHFIDLLRFLASSPILQHEGIRMDAVTNDTASVQLGFADGSIGTIHYFANGSKSLAKERLEVFAGGRVLQLDNFRKLRGFGWPGFSKANLWRQDKGQQACVDAFLEAIHRSGPSPIDFRELVEVSRLAIVIDEALRRSR
jgi:predicted dehydrogenase